MGSKTFHLDKRNGKVLGVCAGLADYFDIDATIVRIGAVVLTLVGGFPWTLLAYGAIAWAAKPKLAGHGEADAPPPARTSAARTREKIRDIDRRMAQIETYVTHSNSPLAREIEELR